MFTHVDFLCFAGLLIQGLYGKLEPYDHWGLFQSGFQIMKYLNCYLCRLVTLRDLFRLWETDNVAEDLSFLMCILKLAEKEIPGAEISTVCGSSTSHIEGEEGLLTCNSSWTVLSSVFTSNLPAVSNGISQVFNQFQLWENKRGLASSNVSTCKHPNVSFCFPGMKKVPWFQVNTAYSHSLLLSSLCCHKLESLELMK